MDAKKIGTFIAELRKEQNLTQSQLAEKLHVTDKAISKWERGAGFPDVTMIEPLADVLHISIVELLKGERVGDNQVEAADIKKAFKNLVEIAMQKRYRKRWQTFCGVVVVLIMIVSGIFYMKEEYIFEIWERGFHAMINYPEEFDTHSRGIIGEWKVDIDLENLESNLGKVVFEKDGYSIVVDNVYSSGDNGENYCVNFMAYGKSDLNHGSIYSALRSVPRDGGTSVHMEAQVKINCNGVEYTPEIRGWGSHPKNGQQFDYYVYPFEAQNIEFPNGKSKQVTIIFETLVYQEWNRVPY